MEKGNIVSKSNFGKCDAKISYLETLSDIEETFSATATIAVAMIPLSKAALLCIWLRLNQLRNIKISLPSSRITSPKLMSSRISS